MCLAWSLMSSGERLRAQGKHIREAATKNIETKWLQNFEWVRSGRADGAAPGHAAPRGEGSLGSSSASVASSGSGETWAEWNSETRKAYRCQIGCDTKDPALEIVFPENGEGHDSVTAVFEDGSRLPLTDLTIDEYKAITEVERLARVQRGTANVHWKGVLMGDLTKELIIKDRKDRVDLISLFEGKSQILQVAALAAGDKNVAVDIMKVIGEKYANGTYTRVELKRQRDALLAPYKKKKCKDTTSVKKKPAAAKVPSAASTRAPTAASSPTSGAGGAATLGTSSHTSGKGAPTSGTSSGTPGRRAPTSGTSPPKSRKGAPTSSKSSPTSRKAAPTSGASAPTSGASAAGASSARAKPNTERGLVHEAQAINLSSAGSPKKAATKKITERDLPTVFFLSDF